VKVVKMHLFVKLDCYLFGMHMNVY